MKGKPQRPIYYYKNKCYDKQLTLEGERYFKLKLEYIISNWSWGTRISSK